MAHSSCQGQAHPWQAEESAAAYVWEEDLIFECQVGWTKRIIDAMENPLIALTSKGGKPHQLWISESL